MFTGAIFSFLTGAVGRALIGHLLDWFQKKQEHIQELERIREQETIDQAKHVRQLDLIKQQSDLKIGEIKLVGETTVSVEEAKAFTAAMDRINTPTGVKWIDGWNGTIRPAAATIALAIWLLKIIKAGATLSQWDSDLVSAILGYYFADRHLGKK